VKSIKSINSKALYDALLFILLLPPTICSLAEKDPPAFKGQQAVKWDTAQHFFSHVVDFLESRLLIHLIRFIDKETQYSKHVES
jgi:hypothetical protein